MKISLYILMTYCGDFLNFPCHFLGALLLAPALYPCLLVCKVNLLLFMVERLLFKQTLSLFLSAADRLSYCYNYILYTAIEYKLTSLLFHSVFIQYLFLFFTGTIA